MVYDQWLCIRIGLCDGSRVRVIMVFCELAMTCASEFCRFDEFFFDCFCVQIGLPLFCVVRRFFEGIG
jgi:hypothetical protein